MAKLVMLFALVALFAMFTVIEAQDTEHLDNGEVIDASTAVPAEASSKPTDDSSLSSESNSDEAERRSLLKIPKILI